LFYLDWPVGLYLVYIGRVALQELGIVYETADAANVEAMNEIRLGLVRFVLHF
jgi:hypothetical protein